jgi:hypothetical protein
MNAAYNEISCADAAKMIGIEYSSVAKWCKSGKINCANVSGGTSKARYVIQEDEVDYIKHLKQKFGKGYMKKYRKDWRRGHQLAEPVAVTTVDNVVYVEPTKREEQQDTKTTATIKSVVTDIVPVKKKADIDELAIKIGYIQDIKDKLDDLEIQKSKMLEALETQKNQLTLELETLRKEVMEYL